ncbi:unnamed protein product [Darwinula stevensoni]|uniref:Gelsolin-like domain-containing protein n=1 Tax=Darwinula stevensoni TaxID=69355 RepID=A0A7R9AEL2_9CRUS|nr:unnamed protein product [Darwinula stevensoni]CAG0902194.1 unnamed protein product [Darwinula stevensoni]
MNHDFLEISPPTQTKEVAGKLSWDIHFWLGAETSQDEAGAAAIKSVELDDQLGGAPVQHREVEGHESTLFLAYFKSGVKYLPGGVKSGFTHVDPDAFEKRLFHVKGRRNIRVKQVEVNVAVMNKGDCWILDAGKDIYVYSGSGSRRTERLKAVMVANELRDEDHAGKARIHIIDEHASEGLVNKFFEELGGGSPDDLADASVAGDDAEHERQEHATVALHKISDESGALNVVKIGEKPLRQDMLDSQVDMEVIPGSAKSGNTGREDIYDLSPFVNNECVGWKCQLDCFLLDTGSAAVYVWIGKGSSKAEKIHAMDLASKYLQEKGYPLWTKIERVVEGTEPAIFKQYFSQWKEPADQVGLGRIYTKAQIAATMASSSEAAFDVCSLHAEKRRMLAKNAGQAVGFMPDDGSGKVEVFRVENFELAPLEEEKYGMFFGGDSYVLRYAYGKDGRENYIVYFWQGRESSQDEKAASAIHAVKLDDELGGKAVQVRVVHGQEPEHFLRIFKGKMVIFLGGHASGFRNLRDHDTYDVDGTRLFRVRGLSDVDVRAEQVEEKASSLASDDVFVLEIPSDTFIWVGKGASEEEKEMAKNAAGVVSPDRESQVIAEGEEPDSFWTALGGKGEYKTDVGIPEKPLLGPRLFHCILPESGKLRVEEVEDFGQQDLETDDVMVLDTGAEVYVWVGEGASPEERQNGFQMAEEYIRTDPTDREKDSTVIFAVKQGMEPEAFKLLFPSWSDMFWKEQKSLEDVKQELDEINATIEE